MGFFCVSFVYLFDIRSINLQTIHLGGWKHIVEQLRYTTLKNDVCRRANVAHVLTRLRGHCLIWSGCHIIRRSFALYTSFTALLTDWTAATARRSRGSTQKSHVEMRWVRNRPNSNADCCVYTALQLGAGGCPRCMCRRRRRVRGGGVFGREQAITTSISHPDSLRDGKWLLVGFGRWLWMKKV